MTLLSRSFAAALIRDVANSLASNVRDMTASVFENAQDSTVKSALRGLQLVESCGHLGI